MKKQMMIFLSLCLLVLTGCSTIFEKDDPMDRSITFYYAAADETSYSSDSGALHQETRELETQSSEVGEILKLYLHGPLNQHAKLPFPAEMELLEMSIEQGTLTLYVTNHWLELSLLEEHIAEACLVKTMTQLPEVEQICLRTELDEESKVPNQYLKPEDYLLYDDSATSDQISVKLYFSDTNARYLVEENRTRDTDTVGLVPEFIMKELLKGPETEQHLPVLPEGVNLLGVELNQGVCTVNFSEAFLTNRPLNHAQARMTVFAVVNSLTELPEVESVRFHCVGKEIGDYSGIDLSQLLFREENAIHNDQPSAAVLDGTLYVPCGGDKLAAVPMTIRQSAGKMGADAILSALLSFKPANGYENPFPDGTALVEQSTRDGICTVTFNHAFALRNADPQQLRLSIRSVVATLCAMEQINCVVIKVNGDTAVQDDLGQLLEPQSEWFLP